MNLPDLADGAPGNAKCAVCGQAPKHTCAPCGKTAYCSGAHQQQHWEQHRAECLGFVVKKNEKVGRYAVAARSLEPGEVILAETPVAVGPKTDSLPLCLGCYNPSDGSVTCSKCGWPMCGPECEKLPVHADNECPVFSAAGVRFQPVEDWEAPCPQLECITPLRLLLARDKQKERWEAEVQQMEAHNDERKETPGWEANEVNVVQFLRNACKLADKFTEQEIHTACGYLEVNAFEIRCLSGVAIRGLYPKCGIMSHNCVANTTHTISLSPPFEDPKLFTQILRTTIAVPKGGELFVSYTHSLEPTLVRRELLRKAKYFDCDCARCIDPTELGSNLSTLKCSKCDNGWIMSSNPLQADAQWRCTACEFVTRGDAVRRVFSVIQREIDTVDAMTGFDGQGIEAREQLMRKYKSVLHPRNAYFTGLRYSLAQMYGRAEGYQLDDLPDILLERKVELCRDLLAVLDVVKPGYTRIKGMTLYELHAPLMILARSQLQQGLIDDKALRAKLEEAADILQQAANILKLEEPCTAEGSVGLIAEQSLVQLRMSIDSLPENMDETLEEEGPFQVEHSDTLGRYLTAKSDLKPGEVLLKEKPLVLGPRIGSTPLCLSCYVPLPVPVSICSQCKVAPVCGAVCERCGDHSEAECEAFRRGTAFDLTAYWQVVMPLRCLLLRRAGKPAWDNLISLESHIEERRNLPIWMEHQFNVVQVLREQGLLQDDEDDELLQKLCGILDVNSFEVRTPAGTEQLRGIYSKASLLAHDCVPNIHLSVDEKFAMTIRASVAIPKGNGLFFSYTSALQNTIDRQEHLSEGKYFHCLCTRCMDPTEMGTHLSSLQCVRCKLALMVPREGAIWTCEECGHSVGAMMVASAVARGRERLEDVDRGNPRELEILLHSLQRSFAQHHAICLEIKQLLVALYRDIVSREPRPQRKMLIRKAELCRELLPVLGILEPGISRLTGITLYELQTPLVLLATREFQSGDIKPIQLLERLREAETFLRDAISHLLYEPARSPEGQLARVALNELRALRQNIQTVHQSITK
ncbi:uncharacterized protein [Anabrus simplex]|uniref:uncharacterized protein n=1 Tax=Anabrus simplex TaxID=316456 RepID=UPI0035A276C5